MANPSTTVRSESTWPLTIFVTVVTAAAVVLSAAVFLLDPPPAFRPADWLALLAATLVLHVLNQLNFTIRFSGQRDNVEITFTEAALVALFFRFTPAPIVVLSGLVHLIREIQAHRRRRIQLVFNTAEIMVSVALAGLVYGALRSWYGLEATVGASVAAMLTHAVSNRLLVGTVIGLSAGQFHVRYYKSLFIENVVMLFMNLAVGMTAVMAFALDTPLLLWVPFTILAVVYLGYQAYVSQLRDANTLTRLYENALLTKTESEAELIPDALAKALDNFGSREVSLTMQVGPDALGEWTLERDHRVPSVSRAPGRLADLDGASRPLRIAADEPEHARAWRTGARYNAMAAPVQYEGQLTGVLRLEKPRAWDAFTPSDLRAFSLFARQLGVALENARLQELDREQQHLRQKALDAERNRISRDLHDSFVQTLVQVDLHLAYLQRLIEKRPADVPREIEELQGNVREGLVEARSYMAELKPLRIEPGEFLGVAQQYLDDFTNQNGIQTELVSDGRELALSGDDLSELFQIVREALNNVAKHAKARKAAVRLRSDETHIVVVVQDDGVGFDVGAVNDYRRHGHFGLANICERAGGMGGAVYWDSAPGQGTSLTVTLPRRAARDILKGVPA